MNVSSKKSPTIQEWLEGARLRTLPAAVAPVIVGTAAAAYLGKANIWLALLAAGVALSLQIGVNFANDYSDGIRGTDENRTGPQRLTASGVIAPAQVKRIAFIWLGVGAVFGLALIILSQTWWLLAVGAAAILAAWFYTGGKNPYGYRGLGEISVMIFFGWVATLGTMYTQSLTLSWPAILGGTANGLFACALLMANNIRDIPTDVVANKRTLAVRLGDKKARIGYVLLLLLGVACGAGIAVIEFRALAVLVLLPVVFRLSAIVLRGAVGKELIVVLRNTGFLQLGAAIVLAVALVSGA